MLSKLPIIRALSSTRQFFSTKKIEVFINGRPYQVITILFRSITICPSIKRPKKMVLKFPDFVIMKDLKLRETVECA